MTAVTTVAANEITEIINAIVALVYARPRTVLAGLRFWPLIRGHGRPLGSRSRMLGGALRFLRSAIRTHGGRLTGLSSRDKGIIFTRCSECCVCKLRMSAQQRDDTLPPSGPSP